MAEAHVANLHQQGEWHNYHKTGTSRLLGRYALRSGDAARGREDVRQAAQAVQEWLQAAQSANVPVRPVGGAWSPSNIQTVDNGWMLNTRRFNRVFRIAADDLLEPDEAKARSLMLVEGGVQIDEINDKLEQQMERSLRTSGASNGQTLPGACATGTHGSVLEASGIQEHVRAIQIVTPSGIRWIEPAAGLMSDGFIAATGATAWRDDEAFAAALMAVGALGIVTAMVIETVERYLVRPMLKRVPFGEDDLAMLEAGDFRGFSRRHGLDEDPYFVMVVANPYKPVGGKAVVRFLYRRPYQPNYPRHEPAKLGAGYDSFTLLGWALRNFPLARGWILQLIMQLAVGKGVTDDVRGTWGETTETHKPLANLFTGALFFDRKDLVRAFTTVCSEFTAAGGATAVTMRFMKGGTGYGLLSPPRWPDTVGIDCDGPGGDPTEAAFRSLLAALDRKGIPFTRHWGKFNDLDAARVASDFGDDLVRWKAVQDRLLPTAGDRALFAAPALRRLGLI